MRFSRGKNPPYGNDPEPRETPDPARSAREGRDDARASWFTPPPDPAIPEGPRDATSRSSRIPVQPPEAFDADDLYPPDYQPGQGRSNTRAPLASRDPGVPPARSRANDRDIREYRDNGSRAPYEPYERPPREREAGNLGANTRPSWSQDAAPAESSISERFGWQAPPQDRGRTPAPPPRTPPLSAYWEEREERLRLEESGQIPRISPPGAGAYDPSAYEAASAPPTNDEGGYSPYSQQIILPPDTFKDAEGRAVGRGGTSPVGQAGTYRSGAFPIGETYPRSPYVNDGPGGGRPYTPDSVTRSGRLATTGRPGSTGSFATVGGARSAPSRSAASNRAAMPALITDPVVWSFLALALVLTGAIVAFVALRYETFPQQITLHFGPAGASQRDRIGDRQELWTIPFLSGIVLIANTALAFVFDFFDRRDRFVPRLLAIGSALVAAVAWVVLLTLLYR